MSSVEIEAENFLWWVEHDPRAVLLAEVEKLRALHERVVSDMFDGRPIGERCAELVDGLSGAMLVEEVARVCLALCSKRRGERLLEHIYPGHDVFTRLVKMHKGEPVSCFTPYYNARLGTRSWEEAIDASIAAAHEAIHNMEERQGFEHLRLDPLPEETNLFLRLQYFANLLDLIKEMGKNEVRAGLSRDPVPFREPE